MVYRFLLVLVALGVLGGSTVVSIDPWPTRVAAQTDLRGQAQRAFADGEVERRKGTQESLIKSIELYQEALSAYRKLKDQRGEALSISTIGLVFARLGASQQAIDAYTQALQLCRTLKDKPGEARNLIALSDAYDDIGEKQKAIEAQAAALKLWREQQNQFGEATSLTSIGLLYARVDQPKTALDFLTLALASWRAQQNRQGEARTLSYLAGISHALDDVPKTLEQYTDALSIFRSIGDKAGESQVLTSLSWLYRELGEQTRAGELLTQALVARKAASDRPGTIDALTRLAVLATENRDKAKALASLQEAFTLAKETNDELPVQLLIGTVKGANGNFRDASADFTNVARAAEKQKRRDLQAQALSLLGMTYSSLGELPAAAQALEQSQTVVKETADRVTESNTLYWLAQVRIKQNQIETAKPLLEQALGLYERLPVDFAKPVFQTAYAPTAQDVFELYIDVTMQLHKARPTVGLASQAFEANERRVQRNWLEWLDRSQTEVRQGLDLALVDRLKAGRRKLRDKLHYQQRLALGYSNQDPAIKVANEITQLEAELRELESQLRQKSPRFAALSQSGAGLLKDIQSGLGGTNAAVLEIALGRERSYGWLVTATSVDTVQLPSRSEITGLARQFFEQASNPAASQTPQFGQTSESLSRAVFGSLAEKVTQPTLAIVADECLEYIPWSALPKPGTNAPLIAAHEVVQLPSASALAWLQQVSANRPAATKALAVLADPVYDRADSRAGKIKGTPPVQPVASGQFRSISFYRAVQTLREVGLSGPQLAVPRLQPAKNEAKAILNVAPEGSRIGWFDLQASRDTLLSADLSPFRVLHFATHGMVSTEQPTTSGVVLSMVNLAGQSQNGFVLGPDFFNLKLNSDLVVFGNLRASLSVQPQSGGLHGLHRALAYAGSPRLMVGIWPVTERVATTFWTAFYRNLLVEKQRPAAALRAAQLQVMKEKKWASPYYWAAFGMYGDFR